MISHWLFRGGTEMLSSLGEMKVSGVAKKADATYSHASNMVRFFEQKGLVQAKNKDDKQKIYGLTEKGKEIKECLNNIKSNLEQEGLSDETLV